MSTESPSSQAAPEAGAAGGGAGGYQVGQAGVLPLAAAPGALKGSPGDLHGAFMREIRRATEQANGDALQVTRTGLMRLRSGGFVTAREVDRLGRICEVVYAAAHGKGDSLAVSAEVRGIHQEMVAEADASPVALAIASIAADCCATAALAKAAGPPPDGATGPGAVFLTRSDTIDAADVGGAVAGAAVGGVLGGVGGAITGAVVGGIGGSAAAIFTTDGK